MYGILKRLFLEETTIYIDMTYTFIFYIFAGVYRYNYVDVLLMKTSCSLWLFS